MTNKAISNLGSNISRILSSSLKLDFIILVLSNIGAFVNYLFQFFLARSVDVKDYGLFNASLPIGAIIISFLSFLPILTTKYTIKLSEDPKQRDAFLSYAFSRIFQILAVLLVISIAAQDFIMSQLNFNSFEPVIYSIIISLLSVFAMYAQGVLQGLSLYIEHAIIGTVLPIMKVILLIALMLTIDHFTAIEALQIVTLASIISVLFYFYILFKHKAFKMRVLVDAFNLLKRNTTNISQKELWTFILPTSLTLFSISFFSSVDMIIIKKIFPEDIVGMYSGAGLVGKICLILPSGLVPMFFSRITKSAQANKNTFKALLGTIGLTLFISGAFAALASVFPSLLLKIFIGSAYPEAVAILPWVAWSMTFVAVYNILANYLLAKSHFWFLIPTIVTCAILFFTLFLSEIESMRTVPLGLLIANLSLSVVILCIYWLKNRKSLKA